MPLPDSFWEDEPLDLSRWRALVRAHLERMKRDPRYFMVTVMCDLKRVAEEELDNAP